MPEQNGKRIVCLESIAGIAGDMFTAAFLDAGLITPAQIQSIPATLGLQDVTIDITTVSTAGMQATHLTVNWSESTVEALDTHSHDSGHSHTSYRSIARLIASSELSDGVKSHAAGILRLLASAEASVHGQEVDAVSFHEVGDIDSIIDVVMAGFCIDVVSPAHFYATPVKLGRGSIRIRHGMYPIPPPASARLAEGMEIAEVPPAIDNENIELSTPTGLAILRYLEPVFQRSWTPGTLLSQGSGAGTTQLDGYPNIFRVSVFEDSSLPEMSLPYRAGEIVEIRCNIDDQTGEQTGWLLEEIMKTGALDVSYSPVLGKKNRPAGILSVLTETEHWEEIADWLLRNSSTFGLRYRTWKKLELERTIEERETPHGTLRYKIGYTTDGEKLKEKPEFDDLARIWKAHPGFQPE